MAAVMNSPGAAPKSFVAMVVEEEGLAGKFGLMTEQVEKILRAKTYDWIIVQGDTATAAAAAAAGFRGVESAFPYDIPARELAKRLERQCPKCEAPGFGPVQSRRGLPCEACGEATHWIDFEIDGCSACGHAAARPRKDGRTTAPKLSCRACR